MLTAAVVWAAACGAGGDAGVDAAPTGDGSLPTFPSCEDPDWLQEMISGLEDMEPGNPPYSITRYTYDGMTVFYLPAQCCDQLSVLLDRCGDPICAPDGGFSGEGDGRCTDFHETAADESLIWQDPRGTGD